MSPIEAISATMLQDGARVTWYVRAGQGAPLLLLWDHEDGAFLESIATLATSFRVIAPRIPPGTDHAEHLLSFVEGAGLLGVHVVANAAFAEQVMALAGRGGWGDLVRCATVIATSEDLEVAARLLCDQTRERMRNMPHEAVR